MRSYADFHFAIEGKVQLGHVPAARKGNEQEHPYFLLFCYPYISLPF